MDIFHIHNVKVEKANAMLQYRRFRKLAKLFRLVELFSAVVFFSWISFRLPFIIGVLCDYFRQLLSIVVSPLFIFLIGNVIILTLVLKSGQIAENQSDVDNAGSDLHEDVPPVTEPEPEEIVYQDKQVVSEVNTKPIVDYCCEQNKIKPNSVPDLDPKTYRRSQSENVRKKACFSEADKLYGKLKRSETEIGRREVDNPAVDDELSDDEFQKRIEGFIAKQIRFHHEEMLAIVAHN